jgi:hypothetical protein
MIHAAQERGVNRAAQIPAVSDMLSAAEFAKFIGVRERLSREFKSSDIELAPIRTGTTGFRPYPTRYAYPLARISRAACKAALIQWQEDIPPGPPMADCSSRKQSERGLLLEGVKD